MANYTKLLPVIARSMLQISLETTTSDSMAKQLLYTLYVAYCYLTYPNARLSLSWLIKYSCQQ